MIEVKVPEAGESITQVELARWLVSNGDHVEKDQEIAEIDSDKATLTVNAESAGIIHLAIEEGSSVEPGSIMARIEPGAAVKKPQKDAMETKKADPPTQKTDTPQQKTEADIVLSPQAKRTLEENNIEIDWSSIGDHSKRITKKDVLAAIAAKQKAITSKDDKGVAASWDGGREEEKKKMSTLRRKVSERLVAVKNETAMLTTFNEVDMTAIMSWRKTHQKAFQDKYGIKLGFMSFFVKAITESIPLFPQVNGRIEQDQIIIPSYADVGIAVSTPKGLMVPVIRGAEMMSIPELEQRIYELAEKAREQRIGIEELTGGTISITNGGVFGSMLSTPILNPPQSAILGMHKIMDRPVAIQGRVEIRPMMYLALSYDHRIIDGKESVSFLVNVKELLENPERLLLQGKDPAKTLLQL